MTGSYQPRRPGQWIPASQGPSAAKNTARRRHPLSWVMALLCRRRGTHSPLGLPRSTDDVLNRLGELPISTWTYGFDHPSVKHIGPMAQDFATAFGLGSSTRRISAVDGVGVCMASIQALRRRLEELEAQLDTSRPQAPTRTAHDQ